jgi:hypothetical protein
MEGNHSKQLEIKVIPDSAMKEVITLMEQCYDKRIGMLFVIGDVEQPSEKH